MEKEKKHFVLIHGACHGAWCWYKVAALLKSAGHKVTALDMAASGIHSKQVQQLNSINQYFQPLIEFMATLPEEERIILVGHSLGGLCISVAMEMFPNKIAVAVFVTAFMPGHNLCFTNLIHEDLTLAMSLVRPTRVLLYDDEERVREETRVTREKYGTVAKVYVVCEQDKVLKPNYQVSMIERNPTNDVKVIPNADHMPMFSKPHDLFSHLQDIANTYN